MQKYNRYKRLQLHGIIKAATIPISYKEPKRQGRRTNMQQTRTAKIFLKSALMFFIFKLPCTPKHRQNSRVQESRNLRSFENNAQTRVKHQQEQ